jgi:Xaa-Pro aminopeptidase
VPGHLPVFLDQNGLDGFLYVGESYGDADMYYLSRFLAGDRFALLAGEKTTLLVSSMELGRARKESAADRVLSTSEFHITDKLKSSKRPDEAYALVLADFLRHCSVKRLGVPFNFPAGIYRILEQDFSVQILGSPITRQREIKRPEELQEIALTQRAGERAMKRAIRLIAGSEARGGVLFRGGEPLTSERVRRAIELTLLEDGCEVVDTIVAGGGQAADPHARGEGPLPANAPIVIDIFPRSKSSRYFADMTRTVLKGEASSEVVEMHRAVEMAQKAGLQAVREGATGSEVHLRVSDVFLEQGYPEREGCGFTHSTGHGVGLAVHERPSLGEAGGPLKSGQVVTVEPGLYYPDIGGVRLEDLVVVEKDGCHNLTRLQRKLVV